MAVRYLVAAGFAAALLAAGGRADAADEEDCLGCHGLPGFTLRVAGQGRPLAIDPGRFDASAHGDLGCRDCHADIASIPHGEHRSPGCGQPCHGLGGGKDASHEGIYWEFAASAHGSAPSRKIGCLLCHPAPQRGDTTDRDKLREVRGCASCHRDNPKVRAWFSDRHYLELVAGNRRAPSCPDCHTAHRVRALAADESPVGARHRAATCANGALDAERRGACHGRLDDRTVAVAAMNPLPGHGGAGPHGNAPLLLAGLMLVGLVARAGAGLVRGR